MIIHVVGLSHADIDRWNSTLPTKPQVRCLRLLSTSANARPPLTNLAVVPPLTEPVPAFTLTIQPSCQWHNAPDAARRCRSWHFEIYVGLMAEYVVRWYAAASQAS